MTLEKHADHCTVDILHQEKGRWSTSYARGNVEELCKIVLFPPNSCIISAEGQSLRDCDSCRQQLQEVLDWPTHLWQDHGQVSNGYTGYEDIYDDHGELIGHTSRTRFLVKELHGLKGPEGKDYSWHALSFFTKWVPPDRNVVVFFDIPDPLRPRFPHGLLNGQNPFYLNDPYWIHVLLVKEIVHMQDKSVWSIRDAVRRTERTQQRDNDSTVRFNPNYPLLHDIARHAIHSYESLHVGENTVRSLISQHETFVAERPPTTATAKIAAKHISSRLTSELNLLTSLKYRSQSNKERLQNELNLAFNVVTQNDSRISVLIGRAVQSDSTAMKTLAMLTMVFLPATFTSSIFSMVFFDYTPGNAASGEPGRLVVSEKWWIFWAVAIPLTALTVGCWRAWLRWGPINKFGEEEEVVDDGGRERRRGTWRTWSFRSRVEEG
ncbi:MAG: hypothetical protein M1820_005169 [Bogoriella megaspora]|nr:MAG: hypothetical protein M1820_005169 [Bogoriella megaspora]